jgi:glucan biosynthesis protein C
VDVGDTVDDVARPEQAQGQNLSQNGWAKSMVLTQNAGQADGSPELTRRYDVDWLRVLGMMMVFVFHCSRFFDTEGWHVKSPQTTQAVTIFVAFAVQWMMPLFFILSGIGAYHALAHQNWSQFLVSRVKRLVVPLVFGIFVIIAPWQVYLERVSHGQYSGSFWNWYRHDYFHGWYDHGNFAWMGIHLWYLEFLFVFSVLALPLFLWLRSPAGARVTAVLTRFLRKPGVIFLLALPIAIMTFLAEMPAIKHSILGNTGFGGWSLLPYFVILIIGYLLATNDEVTRVMERRRFSALATALGMFVLGYFIYKGTERWTWLPRALLMSPLRGLLCWAGLVAIFGFAGRHLRFRNSFLKYTNEAVLPFYILHQTVILTIGYYVVRLQTSLWLEYLLIAVSSLAVIMALYELLIRRVNILRVLFGMKPLRRARPAPVPQPLSA